MKNTKKKILLSPCCQLTYKVIDTIKIGIDTIKRLNNTIRHNKKQHKKVGCHNKKVEWHNKKVEWHNKMNTNKIMRAFLKFKQSVSVIDSYL